MAAPVGPKKIHRYRKRYGVTRRRAGLFRLRVRSLDRDARRLLSRADALHRLRRRVTRAAPRHHSQTPAPPTESPPPAKPGYDPRRGLASAGVSLVVGLSQGLGLQLVSTNLPAVQGSLGASPAETAWLTTAYFATAIPAALLLTKYRLHFGLRGFASIGVGLFLAIGVLHLLSEGVASAIAVRAALGVASAPLTTLAVLYMIQAFPPRLAGAGAVLGFAAAQLAAPLARVVSTDLLEIGQWHGLFLIDVGLAMLSLAAVNAVGLAPTPRQRAFSAGDAIAFPLFALGITLLCVVVAHGRLRWWTDSDWIGYCAAGAVACLALYALVELNRERPMLDLRWLTQPFMLRFVAAVLLFRIILSEQTLGAVGLMNVLGLTNDQMHVLFWLVFAGMAFGFVLALGLAAVKLHAGLIAALAAGLIAAAAWLDSHATALTRPPELLVTQTLLGGALGLFFAASVIGGFGRVLAEGGEKIVTFIAAYAFAQYFGALLGPAWLGTYVAEQQERHYSALAQHMSLGNPQVAERLAQLGRAVAPFVTDPAERATEGAALLVQQTGRESYVLAYNDLFQIVAAIATAVALWLALTALRAPRVSTSQTPA